jgi:hypothetical protein
MSITETPVSVTGKFTRLWVALPAELDAAALLARLGRGVPGASFEVMMATDGHGFGSSRGFGYISVPSDAEGMAIVSAYNGSKWKGVKLEVAPARPGFLERVTREKQARTDAEAERLQKKRDRATAFLENMQQQASEEFNPILRIRPRRGVEVSPAVMVFTCSRPFLNPRHACHTVAVCGGGLKETSAKKDDPL